LLVTDTQQYCAICSNNAQTLKRFTIDEDVLTFGLWVLLVIYRTYTSGFVQFLYSTKHCNSCYAPLP